MRETASRKRPRQAEKFATFTPETPYTYTTHQRVRGFRRLVAHEVKRAARPSAVIEGMFISDDMTAGQFRKALGDTERRMLRGCFMRLRYAVKQGAQPELHGPYFDGGPVLIRASITEQKGLFEQTTSGELAYTDYCRFRDQIPNA